ncbi:MAG TPA: zf-HC2 domain-containing protein [Candidatus Saccharimonadales bacterium]|nr:zf-HC2 domain-containing protein [Candidatus Saccharimonadales bacterium]
MTRFSRIRRRPDHWASAHERARVRAAERLDGPLGLAEAAWLDEHLAACPACAAVAQAYDDDRLALRGLRDLEPEPPRDLWARTAAAIERESTARGRSAAPGRERGGSRLPLGALSGLAVIAVVVGVSAVSSGLLFFGDQPSDGVAGAAPNAAIDSGAEAASGGGIQAYAAPTPIIVGAGDVAYVAGAGSELAYSNVGVDEVCPTDDTAGCGTLSDASSSRLTFAAAPKTIIGSPTDGDRAVVVGSDAAGGEQLLVVSLPERESVSPAPTDSTLQRTGSPTPDIASEPPVETSSTPVESSAAPVESSAASSAPSSAPLEPSALPTGSEAPTTAPSAEVAASPTPTGNDTTAGSAPPELTPSPEPVTTPSPTPEATAAASLAIVSGVDVVGETAAFSPDGRWFAFTARPSDRSAGPDIWVWRVADETAQQLTTDGSSVFASWDGSTVVGSRPSTDAAGDGALAPTTFTMDPTTGTTTTLETEVWRPALDPGAERAVGWIGTVQASDAGTAFGPADGRLELRAWTDGPETLPARDAQVVTDGPIADFDVRWDETGEWFGVWVAEPADPSFGRLSLYRVDPATGALTVPDGSPTDVPALAGFAIGDGRMAWATPPGQGGEGSRVQIAAWTDDAVGSVETAPGEDVVVVR